MLQQIKRLFSNKFIEWSDYKSKIDFLEMMNFQQQTRKESIANSVMIEKTE